MHIKITPRGAVGRVLLVWIGSVIIPILFGLAYFNSPVYKISEVVYWEALEQSSAEQWAVRWVLANRKDMQRREWGGRNSSFRSVILGGASRGVGRDFTYLHHQGTQRELREGELVLPFAHATRRGTWGVWYQINWDTALFLAGYYSGFARDTTEGASFYVVAGSEDGWFRRMIREGRFKETVRHDAHRFFRLYSEDGLEEPINR